LADDSPLTNSPTITIPVTDLRPGTYNTTLTVSVPGDATNRSATTSVTTTIVANVSVCVVCDSCQQRARITQGLPLVSISGPVDGIFSPSDRLKLIGSIVADPRDGPVSLVWTTVAGSPLNLQTSLSLLATNPNADENLVVLPGAIAAGQDITFRLTATNNAGVGTAEFTARADAPPNAGSCVPSTNTTGYALLNIFVVTCIYFEAQTSELPLTYQAFRRPLNASNDAQDFPLTIAPANSRVLQFRMFAGSYRVVIYVANALGTVQEVPVDAVYTVTNPAGVDNNALLGQLELELQNAAGSSDASKLLNAADLVAQILAIEKNATMMMRKRQMADGSVSAARAEELRDVAVQTVITGLVSEQTVSTLDARMRVIVELLSSGPVDDETALVMASFLADQAAPIYNTLGTSELSATDVITIAGAALDAASDNATTRDTPVFGRDIRAGITALSVATLRELIALEQGMLATYLSANGSASNGYDVYWSVQKENANAPLTSVAVGTSTFALAPLTASEIALSGGVIGYEALQTRQPLYEWADLGNRVRSLFAVSGLALFDAHNTPLALTASNASTSALPARKRAVPTDAVVTFDLAFDAAIESLASSTSLNTTTPLCLRFDGASSYSATQCRAIAFTFDVVTCACSVLPGDFSAGIAGRDLPPGPQAQSEIGNQLPSEGLSSKFLWLVLVLLLLLCALLTILGCLVLYHRRRKADEADTLQPYLDKAAGIGNLALLAPGDDVSDSSELERRDYALPVGVYEIPEASNDSDRRREDFSWGLEGEPESVDASGDRDGDGDARDANADDAARAGDTYKEGRLAKMAGGGAGATATKREGLTTDYDLDRTGDAPAAAAGSSAQSGVPGR
jgi:hypothetical protein